MNLDIFEIPIIDTHEHLVDESYRAHVEKDVLSLFLRHYLPTDLMNAGLTEKKIQEMRDPSVKIEKRWKDLEPFWLQVNNTAYAQALKIAVRDLYKIEQINQNTIAEIANRVEEASKPGLYSHVFQKAGIKWAMVHDLDDIYNPNALYDTPIPRPSDPPELFRKVLNGSALIYIRNKTQIMYLQDLLQEGPIHTLLDWIGVIENVVAQNAGIVAVKLYHAYFLSLAEKRPTYSEAENVFNQLIAANYPEESLSHAVCQPLVDYLTHVLIQEAVKHNIPIQIHTGLLNGSFNNLQNANPMHLIPLLMEYREARFVLFHGSYPWIREYIALGKMYPNVWLDLCWIWVISPQAGRLLLNEIIETIPRNKATAFGGDYIFVEGSYGHSVMARQNIERVLKDKVAEGWFGVEEARQYAKAILYDNALALYGEIR